MFQYLEMPNAIGEVGSPNVGVGEVTVLFVEIVLSKVAFRANGVGTLELFSMSFDASAAVTLIEIMLSSCSGVVGISTIASCLSTLVDDAIEEEEVAGNDPVAKVHSLNQRSKCKRVN